MRNVKNVPIAYLLEAAKGKKHYFANAIAIETAEALESGLHYLGKIVRGTHPRRAIYGLVIVYLVLVVAVNIINLIIWIFAKAKLTVYKERITYADHTVRLQGMEMNCEREIKLEDVGYIHFDYGALSRYGGGSPCILSLFDMHNDLIMEIKNPSFIATLIIIKRCKQADKNIVRKWFVILCAVLYSIAAIVLLFTALI